MNKKKITPLKLIKMKQAGQKITALTAYDSLTAGLLDDSGIDVILVGDSLAMVVQGKTNTITVRLDEIIYHSKCVSITSPNALVVADMPFLSYHINKEDALRNAGRAIQEGGAQAVKIEGGKDMAEVVSKLVTSGIPVMGHIGLTPQDILKSGGYFVRGKEENSAKKIIEDAKSLEQAGVFSIVLECIPKDLAETITKTVSVPTISIGAGKHCDGQILVTQDMLGLFNRFRPKFVKPYANLYDQARKAIETYIQEVKNEIYPSDEHSY
ncbi:3-methyl-2-oxobutanoate hydroxymethyltransferase [bacterium]|nr:3-methyl-2-oxobutanoate hydroxymethyltransferase [bacterium]